MHLTEKEIWTAIHGMVLGAGFLLLFSAGFFSLWSLRANELSASGLTHHLRRLAVVLWCMALLSWATVILGTYWSYPWYRAKIPTSPRSILLANPNTAEWHNFGMEWKEHIAWFVPMLLTAIAFVATTRGRLLATNTGLRRTVMLLFCIAFFCAGVAGIFGALIDKAAPVK
jgi:hypothetical protein